MIFVSDIDVRASFLSELALQFRRLNTLSEPRGFQVNAKIDLERHQSMLSNRLGQWMGNGEREVPEPKCE